LAAAFAFRRFFRPNLGRFRERALAGPSWAERLVIELVVRVVLCLGRWALVH